LFPVQDVSEKIRQIKKGDRLAREDFLENCKPFVFRAACKFSGRVLEWGRDDELAVALIAFDEAIERYREDSGVPFPAFARMVIVSRLADHRRRENRNARVNIPLPAGDYVIESESNRAWEVFWEEEAAREREEEIKEYEKLLNLYGVTFEELVRCSPRHRDTRRSLLQAARVLVERDDLFAEFIDKKKLPLLEATDGAARASR